MIRRGGGLGNTVLPVGIPLSGLSKIPTSRFSEMPFGKAPVSPFSAIRKGTGYERSYPVGFRYF